MTHSPETFADEIPIERLTTGLDINVPGFGPAEVYGVEFDGSGYTVQYARSARGGWDDLDSFYVDAGGSVEHAGIGEPRWIRGIAAVTDEEWQAKAEAAPVNLLDAVQAYRSLTASQAMVTDLICAAVYASASLPSLEADVMEAAE